MKIIIASKNVHKIREFRVMLRPLKQIDLYSLLDYPDYEPPEEIEDSFEGNAALKALKASKELDEYCLADDSGLVVPALNRAPGIYSARYAGESASDADNRKKLLKELNGKDEADRNAFFECCLVLAKDGEKIHQCTAYCEGRILEKERGGNGFGYDPLFVKEGYDKTFSEMDEDLKNRISHRGKAIEKMVLYLESHLQKHRDNALID